ncbi:flavodoxin family protein [Clostridium sporogenes]
MKKKILLGIVIILVVWALCMGLFLLLVNMSKESHEEVLKRKEKSLGKALIVYQPSVSDASSRIAHQIAKGLNESGYEVTLNHPGKYLPFDLSDYKLVVFGSPTYCSITTKALVDYMSSIKDNTLGKVVLYSTGTVPNNLKEFDAMEKQLNDVKPYKKVKFNTYKMEENYKSAYELGKELAVD